MAENDGRVPGPATAPADWQAGTAYDGLDAMFAARLRAMVAASGGRITLRGGSYGFRSYEDQERLWNKAVERYGSPAAARKWAAVPGRSNHGRGIAYDLGYTSDEAKQWAHRNAARFGLHFPMDHEDWHVEPIRTTLDEDFDPEAYTIPPAGAKPVGDPHDPAFQMTRVLAMMDTDLHAALAGPGDPTADATSGALMDSMGPGGDQGLTLDEGASVKNYGFADEPDAMADEMQEALDGDR